MIRIADEQFQKRVHGGTIALDRAAVVTVAITLRDDQPCCPAVRCDAAFGTETPAGEFAPWDYLNPTTTIPFFIEGPEQFAKCMCSPHSGGTVGCGCDLAHELLTWIETFLVKRGDFGPRAEALRIKPKMLELSRESEENHVA